MAERLRRGLHVLWRGPGRLQVGLNPRTGVVLDGLTPADEQLVGALRGGTTAARLRQVAARLGVPPGRADDLVAALRRAGVLAGPPTSAADLRRIPETPSASLLPDATVLGVAHPDGDGWHVLLRRAARCVAVLGAGRTGVSVALGLAAAGVGRVLVEDDGRVEPGDVAPGLYGVDDVGRLRAEAARQLLARRCPQTRTSAPGPVRPDLVVLLAHGAVDPVCADGLLREDVAHLAVIWGERHVEVGPLVLPGATGCLRCQHLHRTDRDPEWPLVAAQLAARAPGAARPAEERSLASLAAALATSQVLAHLDGASPVVVDQALEVSLPDGAVASRRWPLHPRCGCAWPLGAGTLPCRTHATGTTEGAEVTMVG